jgi:hypothetical protein
VNAQVERLFGYGRDELLGMPASGAAPRVCERRKYEVFSGLLAPIIVKTASFKRLTDDLEILARA